MRRANWKIPYVNFYLLRQYLYQSDFPDTVAYIWRASGRIFFGLFNKEFRLSRGNSLLKFKIKASMFNTNLGEYIISKNMGISIHERNTKKKKKKKKRKGVLANPIGYRLEIFGNWKDIWISHNLTYTEFLHTSLNLRKFIVEFFEQKSFWETGILLNNLRILNTNKGVLRLYLNWYPGKSYDKKKWFLRTYKYKKYILKFISFYRVWQTRIYWLRYKFSRLERKHFHKLLKIQKAYIIYKFNDKVNYSKRKAFNLKYKYTNQGKKILSNFVFNKEHDYNKNLNLIFSDMVSRKKRSFEILKGNLQRKENDLLNFGLKQENILKTRLSYLRQFFSEISLKRDKYIGLNNLLTNNSLNIWKLLLNVTINEQNDNRFLKDLFYNQFSYDNLKRNLTKMKIYLNYKLLDVENKILIEEKHIANKFFLKNLRSFLKFILNMYIKYVKKNLIVSIHWKKNLNIYKRIFSEKLDALNKVFKNKKFIKELVNVLFRKLKFNKYKKKKKYKYALLMIFMFIKVWKLNKLQNKVKLLNFYKEKLQIISNLCNKEFYNKFFVLLKEKKKWNLNLAWKVLYMWEKKTKRFCFDKFKYPAIKKDFSSFKIKNIMKNKVKWSKFLFWFPRFFSLKIYSNLWNDMDLKLKSIDSSDKVKQSSSIFYNFFLTIYKHSLSKEFYDLTLDLEEKDRWDRYVKKLSRIRWWRAKDKERKIKSLIKNKRYTYYRWRSWKYRKLWKNYKKGEDLFYEHQYEWKTKIKTKLLWDFYRDLTGFISFEDSFFSISQLNTIHYILYNPMVNLGPSFYNQWIDNLNLERRKVKPYIRENFIYRYLILDWRPRFFFQKNKIIRYFEDVKKKLPYRTRFWDDFYKEKDWNNMHYNVLYFLSNFMERSSLAWVRKYLLSKNPSLSKRFFKRPYAIYKDILEDIDQFLNTYYYNVFYLSKIKAIKEIYPLWYSINIFLLSHKYAKWTAKDERKKRRYLRRKRKQNIRFMLRRIKLNPGLWGSPVYRRMMRKRYLKDKSFTIPAYKSWPAFWYRTRPRLRYKQIHGRFKRLKNDYYWYPWEEMGYLASICKDIKWFRRAKYRYDHSKPFLNVEGSWILWISWINLFYKKRPHKIFEDVKLKSWYLLNFKLRLYSLYFYKRFGYIRGWISRLFWAKYVLKRNNNLQGWLLRAIKYKGLESFIRQRLGFYLYKENRTFLKDFSLDLKKNLYSISGLKVHMNSLYNVLYRDNYIKANLKKFNVWNNKINKRNSYFWYLSSRRAESKIKYHRGVVNILRRKRIKTKKMRKRFYKMTHKSPFAGYAGARILHKDYGKFIDYSKGRVGGRAFVFKDIIKLKKKFFQFYNRKFLLGRGLIEKRKILNIISKSENKARKKFRYNQLKLWLLNINNKKFIKYVKSFRKKQLKIIKKGKRKVKLTKEQLEKRREQRELYRLVRKLRIQRLKKYGNVRVDFIKKRKRRKYKTTLLRNRPYRRRKVKYDSLLKLYFSKNIRNFLFSYRIGNTNYKKNLKARMHGRKFKKYIHKRRFNKLINYRSHFLASGGRRTYIERFSINKFMRQKWWTLKRIKFKLNHIVNLDEHISNIYIKIPLKKKNYKNWIKLKDKHNFKFKNLRFLNLKKGSKILINILKKKKKLKKFGILISKLKQIMLNPELFNRIWNVLNVFDNILTKDKHALKIYVRKKVKKLRKIRTNLIYQKVIDKFRLIFEYMAKRKLELYVFSVSNENIEAELLTRYIFIKFKQKYSVGFMLNPLKRELTQLVKMRVLDGFRIRLSGRFNRRQRSKVITLNYGLLPLTEKTKNIDFNERTLVLRFSILSIRVWLCRNDDWVLTRNLQFVSPISLKNKKAIRKRIVKYYNNFTNYGYYSEMNNTKYGLRAQTFDLLKKKMVKNGKGLEMFKQNKPSIYGRFFNDNDRIYEEAQSLRYNKVNFLDASVRCYLNMKVHKKIKERDRWQIYRETIEKEGSYEKYKLYKKIANNYKRYLN